MRLTKIYGFGSTLIILASCTSSDHLGKPPTLTPNTEGAERLAMLSPGLPLSLENSKIRDESSLWDGGRQSLLGDRRAMTRGDILTVVIEIDDEAEISNSTSRSRNSNEQVNIPQLFGIPQRVNENLPEGASLNDAVDIGSASSRSGEGSVERNEKLALRIAATITDVMPNGVLSITGSQEVRVNFELRELLVSGLVRPEDITRQNEIFYDKIASARISYGGRGQITDAQQARYGSQILDAILPF